VTGGADDQQASHFDHVAGYCANHRLGDFHQSAVFHSDDIGAAAGPGSWQDRRKVLVGQEEDPAAQVSSKEVLIQFTRVVQVIPI